MTHGRATRLRHPGRFAFGVILVVGLGIVATPLVLLDLSGPNSTGGFGSRAFFAAVMTVMVWGVEWNLVIRPAVLLMPWGLRISNPLKAYDIPWADIRDVTAPGDGSLTVASAVLGEVHPFVFQSSLIGIVARGPVAHRALDRLTAERAQAAIHTTHLAQPPRARWQISVLPATLALIAYLTVAYLA